MELICIIYALAPCADTQSTTLGVKAAHVWDVAVMSHKIGSLHLLSMNEIGCQGGPLMGHCCHTAHDWQFALTLSEQDQIPRGYCWVIAVRSALCTYTQ